ncbi:MAG: hypothetical protein H8D45_25435 [Bacteroidetes bacterium]|nr:hypothetical protein [Bacteroidota bacterium]MBL7105690.1 hypothetical protein [Bacteroidales bacterium]
MKTKQIIFLGVAIIIAFVSLSFTIDKYNYLRDDAPMTRVDVSVTDLWSGPSWEVRLTVIGDGPITYYLFEEVSPPSDECTFFVGGSFEGSVTADVLCNGSCVTDPFCNNSYQGHVYYRNPLEFDIWPIPK